MDKIGIMQGRVIPERLDKLQMFPISNWQEELLKIKRIGFKYVELLFDKNLVCKELLLDPQNVNRLGIGSRRNNTRSIVNSMCVDYLTSISTRNARRIFYTAIVNVINLARNTTIKVLVVPFFDENFLESQEEFKAVFDWLRESGLDEIAIANNILLALELSLPALQIRCVLEKYRFKNIKVCYDLGNARAMGYSPENEIIELGDFICHVHIKDRKVNGPNVMLGKGDVDFKACFNSLNKIGYKGIMILETKYYNSPVADAVKNLQFIKSLLLEV